MLQQAFAPFKKQRPEMGRDRIIPASDKGSIISNPIHGFSSTSARLLLLLLYLLQLQNRRCGRRRFERPLYVN